MTHKKSRQRCRLFFAVIQWFEAASFLTRTRSLVGAGLLAMVVNDSACCLNERGALESIASKLASTGIALSVFPGISR
jgi:hypothetical protein